jgi:hypothetical protein
LAISKNRKREIENPLTAAIYKNKLGGLLVNENPAVNLFEDPQLENTPDPF